MATMGTPPVVQHDLGFDPPRDRITPKYAKAIGEAPEGAYRVDVDVVNFDNNLTTTPVVLGGYRRHAMDDPPNCLPSPYDPVPEPSSRAAWAGLGTSPPVVGKLAVGVTDRVGTTSA
jgi:hypothetical protein